MGADGVDILLHTDPGVDLGHSFADLHTRRRLAALVLDHNLHRTAAVDRIPVLGSGRIRRHHHRRSAAEEEAVADNPVRHHRRTSSLVEEVEHYTDGDVEEVEHYTAGDVEEWGCTVLEGPGIRRRRRHHLGWNPTRRCLARRWHHLYRNPAAMATFISDETWHDPRWVTHHFPAHEILGRVQDTSTGLQSQ